MSNNSRIYSGLRLSGHALNPDRTACNCGAKPTGWDASIPVRHWHGEHKMEVLRAYQHEEDMREAANDRAAHNNL